MIENNPSLAMFFGTTAAIGGALFVIRLVLFLVGAGDQELGGGDGHLEGGSDSSFQFISLQGVAGFFTMFGLVGLAMLSGGPAMVGVELPDYLGKMKPNAADAPAGPPALIPPQ